MLISTPRLTIFCVLAATCSIGCSGAGNIFGDPNLTGEPNHIFDPNGFIDPNLIPGGDGDANTPDSGDSGSLALFDEVWRTFDETYSHFAIKGVDWDAVYDEHRSDFAAELSAEAFAQKLAETLRVLDDLHVNVQTPDGAYLEVAVHEVTDNYTSTPRNRYAISGYQTLGDNVVWHAWYEGNIAYVRVDTLATGSFASISDDQIEQLFATYASADGFILDIRANNGGDERIAAKFASHLADTARVYGHTRTRNGPGHDDFDDLQEKSLEPASAHRFLGPAACLIGARNISSAEWFALMMRACPNVTLIGDTTRGSSGNPQTFTLSNGVSYSVPTWIAYTDDLEQIEDQGIAPEIAIPAAESFDGEHDYVIERALSELAP